MSKLLRLKSVAMATNRMIWVPACSSMVPEAVVQVCQPPVGAKLMSPVASTPPNSRRNDPLLASEATRASTVYRPAAGTTTVYSSHSPATIQPTLKPPPVSAQTSMSTPSAVRYWPPWLADSLSL
jgi:hypothetical protein